MSMETEERESPVAVQPQNTKGSQGQGLPTRGPVSLGMVGYRIRCLSHYFRLLSLANFNRSIIFN